MATEILETERKYEAQPGVPLPPLDTLPEVAEVSVPETETLVAEYYDTDDLRLLKAGATLRRRAGGADEGWHLKLPSDPKNGRKSGKKDSAGAASRLEIRLPASRPGDPVPDELARLVRVHTRGAALRPVARLDTRRRTTTLLDTAGTSLAAVMADEVAAQTFGESTTLSRWNEIEVELTGGGPRLLRAADKRLRHGGLRPAAYSAKLARALAGEAPPSGDEHPLSKHPLAGEIVFGYLSSQAATLKALDPAVRRGAADSIHQMRVAARRLRSTLQSFPAVVPAQSSAHLRKELKWLGGVLGDARDSEVLSDWLLTRIAGTPTELVMGPVAARVRAHFAPREADAQRAVLLALDSQRYFSMLDELDRLLEHPPLTAAAAEPADKALPRAVARAHRRTARRMRTAKRAPAGQARDVALHETRKAAKRARYTAEAAEPASGKKARRFAERMKTVQSVLGDHQDAVNARATAREIGVQAHLAGESAFTFGLLEGRAHCEALAIQRQARKAWRRAAHGKHAWPSAR
ncbi:MAG TPA: CYTH and CHAD domain-containing protein [Trebonia sp.]|nr:CYTH and CHAD domain-containing protein [Trebonia sp.]